MFTGKKTKARERGRERHLAGSSRINNIFLGIKGNKDIPKM